MASLRHKRQEKKLLIGLGSTIGVGSTALLSGFGIVNLVQTNVVAPVGLSLDQVENIPGFNTVDVKDNLFYDTKDFTRFHFGNTWRGQTVTPLGWLGVRDSEPANLYLTGWNGEILWKYTFQGSGNNRTSPVYDLKYDWNTNLIFILSSPAQEGIYLGTNAYPNIQLQVINAATGQVISAMNKANTFESLKRVQNVAYKLLKGDVFENITSRQNHLYYGDVASNVGVKDNVYYTYLPNFMQLSEAQQNMRADRPDRETRDLVSFDTILKNWDKLTKTFQINKGVFKELAFNNLEQNTNSDVVWKSGGYFQFKAPDNSQKSADLFSLVTNPFTTIGAFSDTLIYHFIIADQKAENVYHVSFANENTLGTQDKKTYANVENAAQWVQPMFDQSKSYNWAKNSDWNTELLLSANTRVQHNLFDPNSVVFAYPYTASAENDLKIPAFNVAQLYINNQNGTILTNPNNPMLGRVVPRAIQTTKYEFGKQILEEYEKNSAQSQMLMDPWPTTLKEANRNLKFNRLISVSPFDNTIIFAAPNPFRKTASINSLASDNKFASFWLGTNQLHASTGAADTGKNNGAIRPFLIGNSTDASVGMKPLDSKMVQNLSELYTEGFTFDLSSLTFNVPNGTTNNDQIKRAKPQINLYFNQSGSEKNHTFDQQVSGIGKKRPPIKTSKIGLLDDPFRLGLDNGTGTGNNGWSSYVNNLYGANNLIGLTVANVSNDSFANLITSRANLETWYVKSAFNFSKTAANSLKGNTTLTPTYTSNSTPSVMFQYGTQLPYRDVNALNLYANWANGSTANNSKLVSNFERLLVKNSVLSVVNESIPDKLKLNLNFANPGKLYERSVRGKYSFYMYGAGQSGNVDHERYRRQFQLNRPLLVANPSVELLNSWSKHGYVEDITNGSGEPNISNLAIYTQVATSANYNWADARKPNFQFGAVNNASNTSFNSNTPLLRSVFRIKKPANAPAWMDQISPTFFEWHPTKSSDLIDGEKTFAEIIAKYPLELAKNISLDYSRTKSSGAGLANLTIEGGLQLNPKATQNQKKYDLGDNYQGIFNLSTSQRPLFVTYNDRYQGSRLIYNQNQTTRDQLHQGGFGSKVYNDLKPSWTMRDGSTYNLDVHKNNGDRIVMPVQIDALKNDKVRWKSNDSTPVIKARYTDNSKTKIMIEFSGDSERKNWFNNVFSMYNFALNMYAQFEYTTKTNPQQWQAFTGDSSDSIIQKDRQGSNKIIDHGNAATHQYVFAAPSVEINQVRFRLKPFETHDEAKGESTKNDYIRWTDWASNQNSQKLISTPAKVAANVIKFDRSWINNQNFGQATDSWSSLQMAVFTTYEQAIETQITSYAANASASNMIKGKLKFEYRFNGGTGANWQSKDGLLDKIRKLLTAYDATDGGVFAIGDGTTTGHYTVAVRVSFQEKYRDEFVFEVDNQIQNEGAEGQLKSQVKTEVDLTNYFNWLSTQMLLATKNVNQGELLANSVRIPTANFSQGSQFNGKTFEQMSQILNQVGVGFQFKQWDDASHDWNSTWENLSSVTKYNPKDPKIKIGLSITGDQNVRVFVPGSVGSVAKQEISKSNPWNEGVDVRLQLPIAISLIINDIKTLFQSQKPIQGNTFELTILGVTQFEQAAKDKIIKANSNALELIRRLEFNYSLEHSSWYTAEQLVSWARLENARRDISNNELRLQISLVNNGDNKYELATNERTSETVYEKMASQNPIKIYVNGQNLEQEVQQVKISGDSDNIEYAYPEAIKKIVEQGEPSYLKLEWTALDANGQENWKDVAKEQLPSDNQMFQKIKIRIGIKEVWQYAYVYGPELANTRIEYTIDFSNLKQFITIDPDWFQRQQLSSQIIQVEALNETHFVQWEKAIKNRITKPDSIKNQIEIRYDFAAQTGLNAIQLVNYLKTVAKTPANQNVGWVLQLWDGQQATLNQSYMSHIKARFEFKANANNLEFKNPSGQIITHDASKRTGIINTSNVQTTVDLTNVLAAFNNASVKPSTRVDDNEYDEYLPAEGLNPPQKITGSAFYNNQSWATIDADLKQRRISINFSSDNGAAWSDPSQITRYNAKTLAMLIGIDNKSPNLNVSIQGGPPYIKFQNLIKPNENSQTAAAAYPIKINALKLVLIEHNWLENFKTNHGFSGNTKFLTKDDGQITSLVNTIKAELAKTNPDLKNVPIEATFALQGDNNFLTAADLVKKLQAATTDQSTRIIQLKLRLQATADSKQWVLRGAAVEAPVDITEENDKNSVKIYLHDDGMFEALRKAAISGGNNDIQWNFGPHLEVDKTTGLIQRPFKQNALALEYNTVSSATTDTNWTNIQPNQVPSGQHQIYIRLNWSNLIQENKYVLGDSNSRAGFGFKPAAVNGNIKRVITIDLKNIKRIINLETKWLTDIKAAGNLVDLEINDEAAQQEINKQLPPSDHNNVTIEYSLGAVKNNQTQWLSKEQFIASLRERQGRGPDGFILRREAIKVRFGIHQGANSEKYGWKIDGNFITSAAQYDKHYTTLIDDAANRNATVKGIINLNLVPNFTESSFFIHGTNNAPVLRVLHQLDLETAFAPYQSDRIFKIQLTTDWNTSTQWNWNNATDIFQHGKFNLQLVNQTIKPDRKAAIRFLVDSPSGGWQDSKYELLTSTSKGAISAQPTPQQAKILDISNNISITTEIDNPFTARAKKLAIQIRNDQNKAIWEHGQGQFRIVVGNNQYVPEAPKISAQTFLMQDSSLPADQKQKLEFVYHIFEQEPTPDEVEFAKKPEEINRKDGLWNVFDFNGSDDWSTGLKLKVGQFIMVALRVKPEFQTGPNAYSLKADDHSVLIPVNPNQSSADINLKKPGRVAGLIIDPDKVQINSKSVKLAPMDPNLSFDLLDGWTQLKGFSTTNVDNQAEGINLRLNLFNQFHVDKQGQILVSASKAKLVKRSTENAIKGAAYLDENGAAIVDKDGKTVYQWTDATTQRLSKPDESLVATQSKLLVNNGGGEFVVDFSNENKELFSLFKNQKIELAYEAKVGLGNEKLPDFELKKAKTVNLQDVISPQIKFPIDNAQNIIYKWNYADFAADLLDYEAPDPNTQKPVEGFARLKTPLKIGRKIGNQAETEITGDHADQARQNLEQMLNDDFKGQLKFQFEYQSVDGTTQFFDGLNLQQLIRLSNNDSITIRILATDPELAFMEAPQPLVLKVQGLTAIAPARERLQYLRVEQNGLVNGAGSFKILLNKPGTEAVDSTTLLNGWKFMIRVWTPAHIIKKNWVATDYVDKLSNGDKVEWKLVDAAGNPVQDAYYNTIAGPHQVNDGGQVELRFREVQFSNGPDSMVVVNESIGEYPDPENENAYPQTSGFVIGGLQERLARFDLTQLAFEKIIATLSPHYKGRNGHGVLNFAERFFQGHWWVNHAGEVYQAPANYSAGFQADDPEQPAAITLEQFLAHTTFYSANPATTPGQLGWQFSSNATAIDNNLSNGDQLWARFDVAQPVETNALNSNSEANLQTAGYSQGFLIADLPPVNNLTQIPDPMSPLWWTLVALGAVLTLGGLAVFLWRQRHKKLTVAKP